MLDQTVYAENSELWQAIINGLKECILHHGPIDKQLLGSATKRILLNLMKSEMFHKVVPDDVRLTIQQMGLIKTGIKEDHKQKALIRRCNKMAGRLRKLREVLKEKK